MANKERLLELRKSIDEIDRQIVRLLGERFALAKRIGEIKRHSAQKALDLSREKEILARVIDLNAGAFPPESLKAIYAEIINTCRTAQQPMKVAYLGPEATFSHIAAINFFSQAADFTPVETILDVFEEVESGRCHFGVVPVENSIEGTVASTLDAFSEYRLKICGEVYVPVTHDLINQTGRLEDIRKVISHPHALAQCRRWLRKHLPSVPTEEASSTAYAARWAAVDASIAAIASSLAAKTYHLQVVAAHIEDFRGNATRFLIIGKESPSPTGRDKTSLIISLADKPGALFETLQPFARRGINMTKIESRPVKGEPWRYLFFIDILGHIEDKAVREGIEEMAQSCTHLEWLGSYPIGEQSR
ncbi:prephenate dehydratase [Thermosulfuriphilus sp.]